MLQCISVRHTVSFIEQFVDSGFSILLTFDGPALFLLFLLKGAIVGKIFPTSIFLPGYLLAVSASRERAALSILVATCGYVAGQLIIYWISSWYGIGAIRSLPGVSISETKLATSERVFQRYSGVGIFVTNIVPYVGTFIMIPAGMASYPLTQTAFYAFVSTLLNYALIVLIVFESIAFVGLM